jgi:RNA polymerase sigma-70 factor (ECF subfamily)
MGAAAEARRAEFEGVAMPHIHALYSFALRFTRRPQEAEDLVQETLLRGFRFFDRYESGTNIKAWLFKIMRNLFINQYRKAQREPEPVDYGGLETSLEVLLRTESSRKVPSDSPEEVLLSGAVDGEVERAVAEIPEEYRSVLLLSAMEELSYKEIASALSIPIGTVMSRLHRSRRLLQAKLMVYAQERGLIQDPPRQEGDVVQLAAFKKAGGSESSRK